MEQSFYKNYFELEKGNWWFRVRRNIVFWFLNRNRIGQGKKILDYGCGSGFLVGKLQESGLDAYGVDISKEAISLGVSRGIKNLSIASGIELDFADNFFDAVLALDVVEHIEDDKAAIKELGRLVRPGGYLILTVPAYQWMWGIQDEVAHHYRRYSMKSILDLIKTRLDLTVTRKSHFNTFLFFPAAAVRIVSKLFKSKNRESDFDINNKLLNKLLYNIFNLEAKLLRYINFPFGVSILLVLKKNESPHSESISSEVAGPDTF